MKKFLKTILFLCALSSLAYAEDDGMDVLNRMRTKIEKEEKERAKAQKLAEEQARKEAEAQAKALEEQQKAIEEAKNTEVVNNVEEVAVVEEATTMSAKDEKEAMKILDKMRDKIEKDDAEKAKLAKEAKELGVETSDITNVEEVQAMVEEEKKVEEKKVEEVKPRTPAEKLEATRKKAMEKLDFYERVVRSVAREEAEIAGYYEIMGEEKARPSIMDEQAKPVETPQTEVQNPVTEVQQ